MTPEVSDVGSAAPGAETRSQVRRRAPQLDRVERLLQALLERRPRRPVQLPFGQRGVEGDPLHLARPRRRELGDEVVAPGQSAEDLDDVEDARLAPGAD